MPNLYYLMQQLGFVQIQSERNQNFVTSYGGESLTQSSIPNQKPRGISDIKKRIKLLTCMQYYPLVPALSMLLLK